MAWQNTIDGEVVLGDRPYGNFWIEVADPVPSEREAHNASVDRNITDVEVQNPITHRAHREFMLGICTALNIPLTTPGLQRLKAADDAIKALREQRLP